MSFYYPTVLWALSLIVIPIVIHLFNFRVYKIAYFSNIRFLGNIKDASESRSKIKNLIILILRILTIISLVIAFAMPYKPMLQSKTVVSKSAVCIYIDNSFSMNSEGTYGNLIDASRERARMVVNSYPNSQKFIFITNDLEARHRLLISKEQAILFINQCQPGPAFKTISEILSVLNNILKEEFLEAEYQATFYLISDFQKIIADFDKSDHDSSSSLFLVPMATNKYNNIYIDSCWFSNSGRINGKQEELIVRIINRGEEAYTEIPLKLFINGKQKAVNSFNIDANQTLELSINFVNTESGILSCYLEIIDYPVIFDNKLFFSYQINPKTSILAISNKGNNKFIRALFQNDSSFILNQANYGNIKSSEFSEHHVVILDEPEDFPSGLNEELKRFTVQGGVLVIMPGNRTNISELNTLTNSMDGSGLGSFEQQAAEIEKINFEHFIYKDVFIRSNEKLKLPELKSYFNYNFGNQSVAKVLLFSSTAKPLLVQNNYGKGKVYLFCFPLSEDNSDFALHPLFVPTLYNIAAFSQYEEKLFYTIGADKLVDLKINKISVPQAVSLSNEDKSIDFIPFYAGQGESGLRFDFKDNIRIADNYSFIEGDSVLQGISFNYDRKESDHSFYTISEIKTLIEKYGLTSNTRVLQADMNGLELDLQEIQSERKDLWKIFVILALVFIFCEILVIKFWPERPTRMNSGRFSNIGFL
jgi:hypothetical protein